MAVRCFSFLYSFYTIIHTAMSLADALLADLDGLSDGEAEAVPSPPPTSSSGGRSIP